MRRTSTSSVGALHPILFFLFVYGISLFMAIFVCRTIYYSINTDVASNSKSIQKELSYPASAINATVLK